MRDIKLLRTLFFGSDAFALASLKALHSKSLQPASIIKNLEVVTSTKHKGPVHKYAVEHKLPVIGWPLNTDSISGRFDIAAVVSFGHLLPNSVLDQFPQGAVNIHPSLLPRWRGAAPIAHTVLAGDKETGVSLLEVSRDKFDTGRILRQKRIEVPHRCNVKELYSLLATFGADMLVDCFENLEEHRQQAYPQPKGGCWATKITNDLAHIRWHDMTVDEVDRRHRGLTGRFALSSFWDGVRVFLQDVTLIDQDIPAEVPADPGTIFCRSESGIMCVRCKDGWIGVGRVHFEGEQGYISAPLFAVESLDEFEQEEDCYMSQFDPPEQNANDS